MLHTEDFQFVTPYESVYEVQYRRYNAETSLAEPALVHAQLAPGKIWKFWNGCKAECDRLNNSLTEKEEVVTVKMIATCNT